MNKNILMLTSTWDTKYINSLVQGVQSYVDELGYSLHIFNVYDVIEESNYYTKEREIFRLPNIDIYEAVILALSSTDGIEALNGIVADYKKAGKTIVSIDTVIGGLPYVGVDNYQSMYKIVEHLVGVHGCRILNFVGGQKDNKENMERYRAFCDCLKAHNLEIEDRRVRFYNFLPSDGETAFHDFAKENLHTPDAVVCASDYMAMGYCEAAEKAGYRAPDDFLITGFDNLDAATQFFPAISTVDRHWTELGKEAARFLFELMEGKSTENHRFTLGSMMIRESCGCNRDMRDIKSDYKSLVNTYKVFKSKTGRLSYARKKLCGSFNLDMLMENMVTCEDELELPHAAVVLNRTFFDGDYENDKIGFTDHLNSYIQDKREQFDRKDKLLPDAILDSGSKAYLFAPLHMANQTYGYSVTPFVSSSFMESTHRIYSESLSLALEGICQRISLDGMNAYLKELYIRDSLTGLYNRFGYAAKAEEFYEINAGRVYLVYMDLDNLKTLNDKYGHETGDLAIMGVSDAIKSIFTDTEIHVRMGGDEYLVMGTCMSEDEIVAKEAKMSAYLEKYSTEKALPITLTVSMGHVYNDIEQKGVSLEELVHIADNKMYEIKQAKKNGNR